MWEEAYDNTESLKVDCCNYVNICKSCGERTKHSLTDEGQVLGNMMQFVTRCECGKLFVFEKQYGV